jgi:hypothetical protein
VRLLQNIHVHDFACGLILSTALLEFHFMCVQYPTATLLGTGRILIVGESDVVSRDACIRCVWVRYNAFSVSGSR